MVGRVPRRIKAIEPAAGPHRSWLNLLSMAGNR
jgi:hypothetical protein